MASSSSKFVERWADREPVMVVVVVVVVVV